MADYLIVYYFNIILQVLSLYFEFSYASHMEGRLDVIVGNFIDSVIANIDHIKGIIIQDIIMAVKIDYLNIIEFDFRLETNFIPEVDFKLEVDFRPVADK